MKQAMMMWLVAVLLVAARPARADAFVQANCQVGSGVSACTFTNGGADPGRGCATVHLVNRFTQQRTDSATVCSGDLAPGARAVVPLSFPGAQPDAVCLTGGPSPAWGNCELTVALSDVVATGGRGGGLQGLLALVVLGTSLWVYADARHLGIRKGQNRGLLDMGPGGWFVVCLLLWVVGFPAYLGARAGLRANAAGAPPPA